ncbi:MAG: hypothetical protein FJY65_08530 [Calditrichaeota bacterium]|nr:hypothetical protein [Calditrichota bacterium]
MTLPTLTLALIVQVWAATPQRYWVYFQDKGIDVNERIVSLRAEWPENSFQRRSKAGKEVDAADLPVNKDYIDALIKKGHNIVQQSRWLNAVSIEAEAKDLPSLNSLPFIADIRYVASLQSAGVEATGLWTEISSAEAQLFSEKCAAVGLPAGGYGASWQQAAQIGADEAHLRGLSGAGVLIGMLDTGFDLRHRALAGLSLVAQYDFIFNDDDPSWDPRSDPRGQAHHGTACLSVIAGYDPGWLMGIAPRASFALAKTELTGSETAVEEDYWVAGIEWLEWLGADVVSSSLTYRDWYDEYCYDGMQSPATRAAQRAVELGVVICVSAGNGGPGAVTIGAPADAVDVLAIAAVDSNGILTNFSSRGPASDGRIKPDLAAKGRGVVCVSPMTWDRYARWNGTSLACPLAAGAAALVVEAHPDWPPTKVIEALRETASKAVRPANDYGWGIVDCISAIDYPMLSGIIHIPKKFSGSLYLAQYSLTLTSTDGETLQSKIVGQYGHYTFPNLAAAEWALTVMENEKALYRCEGLVVPPSLRLDVIIDADADGDSDSDGDNKE